MYRKISLKSAVSLILATFVIFLTSSCATMGQKVYHGSLMKGSIIETSDSEVYLCIGSKDGASVGQELDVYKIPQTKPPEGDISESLKVTEPAFLSPSM